MFKRFTNYLIGTMVCCPWAGHACLDYSPPARKLPAPFLYNTAQRQRRDASPWTVVQGVLAPVQFAVFLISLGLVLHFLFSGQWLEAATISILIKTGCLLTIMITGAIWEHEVFGQFLFAPAFFWEDVFSFLVIALHLSYVAVLLAGTASAHSLMMIALAAYASYAINASQFLLKLRAARREAPAA